jgi:hypothetical protein
MSSLKRLIGPRKIVVANSTFVRSPGDRSPGIVSVGAQLTVLGAALVRRPMGPNEKWGRINNSARLLGVCAYRGAGCGVGGSTHWAAPRLAA